MSFATEIAGVALILATAAASFLSAYLILLSIAAVLVRPRASPKSPTARHQFAILIPAHNEELLIHRLLDSLRALDYPRDRFDVHVVADNCSDATARVARDAGAIVHERVDLTRQAKGFALQWLLHQLAGLGQSYDAYIVLDADSVVAANLLQAMDARLSEGASVVQAYYSVLNVGTSPVASLRYAALAALHYVRPLGRSKLGWSCGLKGNGMCFAAPVLEEFGWTWFTLAEDVEFHLALARRGIRVVFAPETWVLADMPTTLAQAASQNERWERGRLQLAREGVFPLILAGLRTPSMLRLDAAIEQIIPPLSVLFVASGVLVLLCALVAQPVAATIAGGALVGQIGHLMIGLILVRAPRAAFIALAYAPVYIWWKLGLYLRAFVSARGARWIRTARVA